MNCIVIDDEPLARLGMETHIKNMPVLELIGSFSNPIDAIAVMQISTIDILFLDINMPEISGLEFVKTLTNSPLVIFATAYPQYALDSYELDAVDYLLKPIRFERFVKAVNKAQNLLELLAKGEKNNEIQSVDQEHIFVRADRKFFKIQLKDILYIEGLKDYVIIHTAERKVITAMNLKTILAQLPASIFIRTSKSFIVNTNHIISFDAFNVYLTNVELPLGLNFKDDFLKTYANNKI